MPETTRTIARVVWQTGQSSDDTDEVVVEAPVALVYNGVSHAVMMVTPADLEDFALGFSLSEGILDSAAQLHGLEILEHPNGLEVSMEIAAGAFNALKQSRRSLAGRTGCGLCGVDSLAQLAPRGRKVSTGLEISHAAIQRALEGLGVNQQLKRKTGGVHAAAWCSEQGEVLLLREDVGRHNALDKVLGGLCRHHRERRGFVLVTSRASYEMVTKASACDVQLLATVSAPTDLAIEYARRAGLTLLAYVQAGRQVVYNGGERIPE